MTALENIPLYYTAMRGISSSPQAAGASKADNRPTLKPKAVEINADELHGELFFDTHTHIDQILDKFNHDISQFPAFRQQHFSVGFGGCVTVCCDEKSFRNGERLIQFDDIYAAFGIHPHNAKDYTEDVEQKIRRMMVHSKTVAWGEVGLDYHYDLSERTMQRKVFARQLQSAVSCAKPVVIHTREAEEDTLAIMREHLPRDWRIHVHCFTSSPDMAKALLSEWPNLYIGFTGVITFANLRDVVRLVPLDRFLLETDGPYMAPAPFRGQVCHSGHVPYIARKIAQLKEVSLPEVLRAARQNTRGMYGV